MPPTGVAFTVRLLIKGRNLEKPYFCLHFMLCYIYMYMYITDTLNSDDTARSRKYRLGLKYFNINLTPVKVLNASLP